MIKSALQQARGKYCPKLPKALEGGVKAVFGAATQSVSDQEAIAKLLTKLLRAHLSTVGSSSLAVRLLVGTTSSQVSSMA